MKIPNPTLVGNLLLFAALLLLFFFGALWELLGVFAFIIWMILAAAGVSLLLQGNDRGTPPLSG